MQTFLSRITNPSVPTAILIAVGSLFLWWPTLFPFSYEPTLITIYLTKLFSFEISHVWLVWLTMALTVFNGVLLSLFFAHLNSSPHFTLLPTATYLFLISANPMLHTALMPQIGTMLGLWLLSLLFSIFKNRWAVEYSFQIGLVFSMLSCLVPMLLFLLPVLWIGYAIMQAFSMRMLWASIVGLLTGLTLIIAASVYWLGPPEGIDIYWELFRSPFDGFLSHLSFGIYLGVLLLITLIYWFSFKSTAYHYTLRTRAAFASIALLCLFFAPFLVLRTTLSISFIGFWLSLFSVMHTSFFIIRKGLFPTFMLVVWLIAQCCFYSYSLWPSLWDSLI